MKDPTSISSSLRHTAEKVISEIRRAGKMAAIKAKAEKLKLIDLNRAHQALGTKGLTIEAVRVQFPGECQAIDDLEQRMAEKRAGIDHAADETTGEKLQRVAAQTKRKAEAEAVELKRKQLVAALGAKLSESNSRPVELQVELSKVGDLRATISSLQEEFALASAGHHIMNRLHVLLAAGAILFAAAIGLHSLRPTQPAGPDSTPRHAPQESNAQNRSHDPNLEPRGVEKQPTGQHLRAQTNADAENAWLRCTIIYEALDPMTFPLEAVHRRVPLTGIVGGNVSELKDLCGGSALREIPTNSESIWTFHFAKGEDGSEYYAATYKGTVEFFRMEKSGKRSEREMLILFRAFENGCKWILVQKAQYNGGRATWIRDDRGATLHFGQEDEGYSFIVYTREYGKWLIAHKEELGIRPKR